MKEQEPKENVDTEYNKGGETQDEKRRYFLEFFDKIPDAVIILGRGGILLEANGMVEKLSGYKRSELVGKNILTGLSILDAKTKALVLKNLALQFSGAQVLPFEIEVQRNDGKIITLEINSQLINHMGKKTVVVVLRDTTERKRMGTVKKELALFQSKSESPTNNL
jgi:PAS domain S-box-containing protein